MQDSGARAIVFAAEMAAVVTDAMVGQGSMLRISVGDAPADGGHDFDTLVAAACATEPDAQVSPDMISALVYTSGTTGCAKGVIHTHANDVAIAVNCALEYQLSADDRALHIAPLHHVGGMQAYFAPHLLVGAANIIAKRYSANDALATIAKEYVTSLFR